ncbi:MAG: ABC transporter ATP-binding protein [Lachnospiraceae bacterium]|nr:ABC transporter ATP-binding protein [Lachnospiraceae bacterium]
MEEEQTRELWRIERLQVFFKTRGNDIMAVNEFSLSIYQGERLCLLGESGCGKSVFGMALLKLLPENAEVLGKAYYKGMETVGMSEKTFARLRGTEIAVIPQGAGSSLDPTMRCGKQVEECLRLHEKENSQVCRQKVLSLLKRLELPRLPGIARDYPFELSGGMKQRILVAAGIVCHPQFLLVDEPTKGLDWGCRDKVITLLKKLVEDEETSVLLITHDFNVAKSLADRVVVMYAGEIVEYGMREDVLERPVHPYSKGLLAALPQNGFQAIEGFSPPLDQIPKGCRFHPRCPHATGRCAQEHPNLTDLGEGREVRCFYAEG